MDIMGKNIACALVQNRKSGQSLIEILIAVAIGAIMLTAAATVIPFALRVYTQTNRTQAGASLAKELLSNVRVWAEGDWHNISRLATTSASHYHLNASSSPFTVVPGDQLISISGIPYTRYFYVDDVKRNASDVVAVGGALYDPSTKKINI